MRTKVVTLAEILNLLGDKVLRIEGAQENVFIDNLADMANVNETTLDWVNPTKSNKQHIVESSKARVVLVDNSVLPVDEKVLIVVEDPKRSLIEIMNKFFVDRFQPYISPSAFIHPEAIIGSNNYIGPNCYIGKCVIGDNNVIHSNVCIYDRTRIGNNNVIHSGALICVDGLGCIRDKETGVLTEFPQMGGVIIGDNCYLGGGIHVASGSLSDTIIEDGCKINGLCFIGSNDHLHQNVWITGSTMLAGSVVVGENTNIFSKVVVRDWTQIGESVTIGMGSVVTKDIPAGETWFGNPAHKMEKK